MYERVRSTEVRTFALSRPKLQADFCSRYRRCMANCKKLVSGKTDLALPRSRFGINFMMMVTVLKLHGMSDLRIHEIVAMIYAISITESSINRMVLRMARKLGSLYEQIKKEVRLFPVCNGDESSWRVDGANYWLWVVVTKYAALYHIDKTRKTEVPKKMLGPEYEGRCADPTRGVHGIMSEEDIKNATYTTSVTSRKLF